jgi:small nuclear ribonucleoprotein (snRNP)-like protein
MSGKGIVVSVELKNGIVIQGKLDHVDKYMNFNLFDINVDTEKYPQLVEYGDLRRL